MDQGLDSHSPAILGPRGLLSVSSRVANLNDAAASVQGMYLSNTGTYWKKLE